MRTLAAAGGYNTFNNARLSEIEIDANRCVIICETLEYNTIWKVIYL